MKINFLNENGVAVNREMTEEEKAALAKGQLLSKYAELGRIPQKKDFDEASRSRIKAFLGPWPRALEKAGLKEPHNPKSRTYDCTSEKRREKLKKKKEKE